jgi:hypothetical protein
VTNRLVSAAIIFGLRIVLETSLHMDAINPHVDDADYVLQNVVAAIRARGERPEWPT